LESYRVPVELQVIVRVRFDFASGLFKERITHGFMTVSMVFVLSINKDVVLRNFKNNICKFKKIHS